MVWVPLMVILSQVVVPDIRGTAVGLYRTSLDLGGVLGPIFFVFIYDFAGKYMPFLVGGTLLIASIAVVSSIRERHMLETG